MVVKVLVLLCLIDLAMWLVGSDATNAWQIFAAKLRTHITASGTVPTWSPLCKVLYILTTAIRHSFFRERATGFPNKGEEGPSDNTSCFTQSDDHVISPFTKAGMVGRIPGTGFLPLSVELGFWIPVVSGIPDSNAQDSRFHRQKFPGFRKSGFPNY